jgi:hypothetical protein
MLDIVTTERAYELALDWVAENEANNSLDMLIAIAASKFGVNKHDLLCRYRIERMKSK